MAVKIDGSTNREFQVKIDEKFMRKSRTLGKLFVLFKSPADDVC